MMLQMIIRLQNNRQILKVQRTLQILRMYLCGYDYSAKE